MIISGFLICCEDHKCIFHKALFFAIVHYASSIAIANRSGYSYFVRTLPIFPLNLTCIYIWFEHNIFLSFRYFLICLMYWIHQLTVSGRLVKIFFWDWNFFHWHFFSNCNTTFLTWLLLHFTIPLPLMHHGCLIGEGRPSYIHFSVFLLILAIVKALIFSFLFF